LLKQRQEQYDAQLRQIQQLQDAEERRRQELEQQRQRQVAEPAVQKTEPPAPLPAQAAQQPPTSGQNAPLPFLRYEDQPQSFQRPVPPIANGPGRDSSRIVKREPSSLHLSKSSQSALSHPVASLPLLSNQVIRSPLTSGRSPGASGFSSQFLFPSNTSASATSPTWATTPLVPIPSSSGMSPKPPHTPTSQVDVQMAALNPDARSGEASPVAVDVPISPGITSPP